MILLVRLLKYLYEGEFENKDGLTVYFKYLILTISKIILLNYVRLIISSN
jgi:hypothetical protein